MDAEWGELVHDRAARPVADDESGGAQRRGVLGGRRRADPRVAAQRRRGVPPRLAEPVEVNASHVALMSEPAATADLIVDAATATVR